MITTLRFTLVSAFLSSLIGCVPSTFLVNANLASRIPQIRKVVILPPIIDVYSIAGGVPEKKNEWSQAGSRNVAKALEVEFGKRANLQVASLESDSLSNELKSELEQTQQLFDAVTLTVAHHILGHPIQRLDDKKNNFDYSLGTEIAKLDGSADAFILIKGYDRIFDTFGRAVLVTGLVAMGPASLIVLSSGQATAMNLAFVDARSGDILWFLTSRTGGPFDLRDPSSAAAFVKEALVALPIGSSVHSRWFEPIFFVVCAYKQGLVGRV